MKKISKFIKKNFKGIITGTIIGVLLCGTISVCAVTYFESNLVTYDNTESGLTSSNVQGAIDELYNSCFPKGTLDGTVFEDKIVVSGDGLYKDEYEEGRFIFKGGNPNNYITFNNETAGWRIISIEPDKTIKLIKISSIGNQAWNTTVSIDWAGPATLNTYLNNIYYNNQLNETAQSQIISHDFSIGAVLYENNNIIEQINMENSNKWKGKIALPTISEYIRTNLNKSGCGTYNLIQNNQNYCTYTGWMDTDYYEWSLTPFQATASNAATFILGKNIAYSYTTATNIAVRPTIYLSSEITLSGSGTISDPYTIK